MNRRAFIAALSGAAAAWPLTVRAQQPERMRRICVLMATAADDPEGQARLSAFLRGLQQAGWVAGQNVQIHTRWSEGNTARLRRDAAELVALSPDVFLIGARATSVVAALQQVGS